MAPNKSHNRPRKLHSLILKLFFWLMFFFVTHITSILVESIDHFDWIHSLHFQMESHSLWLIFDWPPILFIYLFITYSSKFCFLSFISNLIHFASIKTKEKPKWNDELYCSLNDERWTVNNVALSNQFDSPSLHYAYEMEWKRN